MRGLLLWGIRLYKRWCSPLIAKKIRCRFHPTCSEYARQAVERYGALRGGWKACQRLIRCRPDNFESCINYP